VPSPDSIAAARVPGSFRDPAGHVVLSDGTLYRQIEPAGREAYDRLMQSGLYDALVREQLLVPHEDMGSPLGQPLAKLIKPERVPMVSYPYEWCFSQLRDAALLTLHAARVALKFGMSLKDASAFNVQFLRGRPVLIDTLSFEPHNGGPWVAYRQFCQHFYAPLLLWSVVDPRLSRLSQTFIDGVPLSLASTLLPRRSWLRAGPLFHVHLHAAAERRLAARAQQPAQQRRSGTGDRVAALLDSLERAVSATRWTARGEWATYYNEQPSYVPEAFARKTEVVTGWLSRVRPATVWDLGANTGQFAKAAARLGASTVAFDLDPACVETLYREVRAEKMESLLPLVSDLTSPSPAIGWANQERTTLEQRGPAEMILALALVHHLAIGNNVPLSAIAGYFARLGTRAIVEFVPKSDAMVQQMLSARDDVFESYSREQFERAFETHFSIDDRVTLAPSDRVLYLLTAR
jgi:hypothetical protein